MNTAKLLAPIAVTGAMLTTSIPETDYPEYVAGTTYAADETVQIASLHRVYRSAVADNVGHYPPDNIYDDEVDPPTGYWIDAGATNAWAMFDGKSRAVSSAANRIEVSLAMGEGVTALAVLNVAAASLAISVVDPVSGQVYSQNVDMVDLGDVVDFFTWFFNPPVRKDVKVLIDLPYSPDATITIIASAAGETVRIGELIPGNCIEIGTLLNGVQLSLEDYSVKEKDPAGIATLTPGIYADTFSLPITIETAKVAAVRRKLAGYHATPIVIIGSIDYYETILYGWYTRLLVVIPDNIFSQCTLDMEELS